MLLYYHGSDTYRLRNAVADVTVQTQKTSANPVSVHTIDGASPDGRLEFERLLKYPSFFEETKIIVVTGALADAETASELHELLTQYGVAALPDAVICISQLEPAGRPSAASKKLTSYLEKHAKTSQEFKPLTGTALARWVRDVCADQGCTISPDAVAELLRRTGDDTWMLANEISKLCAFSYTSEGKHITLTAVRETVTAVQERDEWELSNALAGKDKRGVLAALFRRLAEGTPEQLILGSLAAGIRTLMIVKDLSERRMTPALIARTAALHPYVVSKTLRGATLYTAPQLRRTLSELSLLDRAFKDGRADATDSLFRIVLEL